MSLPGRTPLRSFLLGRASTIIGVFAFTLALGSMAVPPATFAASDTPSTAWWGVVSADLRAAEYRPSPSPDGLQAPNRAMGMRCFFRDEGVTITPRDAADWSWRWRSVGWGREDHWIDLASVKPCADVRGVTYVRGELLEWYVNSPSGLEQGFTIAARPEGTGPLQVRGECVGDLRPRRLESREIEFVAPHAQRALTYGALHALDAGGRDLPASLEWAAGSITLTIDDREALYPVTIDPLVTTPSWSVESNQVDAVYGHSVSTAGDVNGDGFSDVIVGAPRYDYLGNNSGRAFVYLGSAEGLATTSAWNATSAQALALFGICVSTAGDVNGDGYDDIIVGAHFYDNGQNEEGRAYVWYGSASGIDATVDWTAEGDLASAFFGFTVSTAGDVNGDGYADVLVGADGWSNPQVAEGKLFVYHGSATGLHTTPDWTEESNVTSAHYGAYCASAGDVNADGYSDIVVGRPYYANPESGEGEILIFAGSAAGLDDDPTWSAEGNAIGAGLGSSVANAGDVNGDGYADVLSGAVHYSGAIANEGRLYLFAGSASGLVSTPGWTYDGGQAGCNLGWSVATAGDVNGDGYADILAGAKDWDHGETDEGLALLWLGHPAGPAATPDWTFEGDQTDAWLGWDVATAGDINGDGRSELLIGCPGYEDPENEEGCAYAFFGSSDGPQLAPGWVVESNQTSAQFGFAIAQAGDINGDGFGDVLVGAPYYDNGQIDEGAAFLYLGTASGLSVTPAWYAEADQAAAHFGVDVAGAGDVNGDGLEDVLIGADTWTSAWSDEGAASLWYGRIAAPPGTPANADWITTGEQTSAYYGRAVASAGDVNGDGYSDVLVGAWGYDNDLSREGAAFVYHGSATGLSSEPDWFHDSDHEGARYGYSVSSAGDWNGDGFSDVIIGAPYYDHPDLGEGAAFVYLGSNAGVRTGAPDWYAESNEGNALLGYAVASAGDVNGDGMSDVIVGACLKDASAIDGGAAYLWHGASPSPPNGTPDNADWKMGRMQAGAELGYSVDSAGDVNGDGYSDIVVGSPYDDGGTTDTGAAYLWFGSSEGVSSFAADWVEYGDELNGRLGKRVAGLGDVNGDGFSDVMLGAPEYDMGQTNEGRGYLYYGNRSRGTARAARQGEADFSAVIAPLGRSESESSFGLLALGRSAAGRTDVRLVSEVQRFRASFDGTVTRGAWTDTGAPSGGLGSRVPLVALPTGLAHGTLHQWRMRVEARDPYFPRSTWLHHPANGSAEADLMIGAPISAVSEASMPRGFGLSLSPNPSASSVTIEYRLPIATAVDLAVIDVQGRRLAQLVHADEPSGTRAVDWNGRDDAGRALPSGTYFLRMQTPSGTRTERLILTR